MSVSRNVAKIHIKDIRLLSCQPHPKKDITYSYPTNNFAQLYFLFLILSFLGVGRENKTSSSAVVVSSAYNPPLLKAHNAPG